MSHEDTRPRLISTARNDVTRVRHTTRIVLLVSSRVVKTSSRTKNYFSSLALRIHRLEVDKLKLRTMMSAAVPANPSMTVEEFPSMMPPANPNANPSMNPGANPPTSMMSPASLGANESPNPSTSNTNAINDGGEANGSPNPSTSNTNAINASMTVEEFLNVPVPLKRTRKALSLSEIDEIEDLIFNNAGKWPTKEARKFFGPDYVQPGNAPNRLTAFSLGLTLDFARGVSITKNTAKYADLLWKLEDIYGKDARAGRNVPDRDLFDAMFPPAPNLLDGWTTAATARMSSDPENDASNAEKIRQRFFMQPLPKSYSSITVNIDFGTPLHCDRNNAGETAIIALGNYSGGGLFIHHIYGDVELKVERALSGEWKGRYPVGSKIPGVVLDIKNQWLGFDGAVPHAVMPFKGRRCSFVYSTVNNWRRGTPVRSGRI